MSLSRAARFTAVALACALPVAASVTAGASSPARTSIKSPRSATRFARVGAADPRASFTVHVVLRGRDSGALQKVIASVTDPRSAQYGHYLDATQFRARFAPTADQVARVSRWLRSVGLTVGAVPANRLYIPARGTTGQLGRAFGVSMGAYRVRGAVLAAPDSAPSVVPALATDVAGVVGLDRTAMRRPDHIVEGSARPQPTNARPQATPPPGFRNAAPCSTYWGQQVATGLAPLGTGYADPLPYAPCGLTPAQIRKVYGLDSTVASGVDGTGVRVGIVDAFASATILGDAQQYATSHDASHPLLSTQYSELLPSGVLDAPDDDPCDPQGWSTEETLDVEAVHAMAPGADIVYSAATSCDDPDLDAALNTVVDGGLVDMVSNSYGDDGEIEDPEFDAIAQEAAADGIGLYFSSGDDGDETDIFDDPTANTPASSPLVTAVGGTSLAVKANGTRQFEVGWENGLIESDGLGNWLSDPPGDFWAGSGGGTSVVFPLPSYQSRVPRSLSGYWGLPRGRVVPDVAMVGDPNTGFLMGQTQTFGDGVSYDESRIGGTSLSSPLFAAVMAIADQYAGHPHGFVNPALYAMPANGRFKGTTAVKTPLAVVRNDYVNDENDTDGIETTALLMQYNELTIHARAGYDAISGLGVPNGIKFLRSLP